MKLTIACLAPALGLALSAPAALADTWLVDDDGGPGVDFTSLQAAADVALPGDTLLVASGSYDDCLITEGLAVVALPGADVDLGQGFGALTIRFVPAGQTARVAGLSARSVRVMDCTGHVVLDELALGPVGLPTPVLPPLRVLDCALVTLARSTLAGKSWPGLELDGSTLIVSDCDIAGANGAVSISPFTDGDPGWPGIDAHGSTLVLQTTSVSGGGGGDVFDDGQPGTFGDGGDGAPAVLADQCTLQLFGRSADVIRGGWGGATEFGSPGTPGSAVQADGSQVTHAGVSLSVFGGVPIFTGSASTFGPAAGLVPPLTLEGGQLGGSLDITLEGPVGADYLVWASPFAAALPVAATAGDLLLDPILLLDLGTGTLGPTGQVQVSLPLPAVSSLQGVPLHVQAGLKLQPFGKALSTSASCVLR